MTELSMKEIHAITLDGLKLLDKIAQELSVRYFLGFGTLLGAVRHHGFIPWDDDLDVLMLRDDYERLLSYFDAHEKELSPYRMFTNRNTPDYPHMIARLCDTRYPIEVENEKPCGMCLFIDIYPIDGLGKSRKKWEHILILRQQIIAASYYATRIHFEIPKKKYRIVDKYLLYLYAKWKGKDYFLNKLEQYRYRFSWEESDYAGCAVWDNMIFQKEWFREAVRVPFEDMQVLIPAGYDGMLTESYKDYMELPPAEKQKPQHNYKAYRRD